MTNFSYLAHGRRSIRKYTDQDVSTDIIRDIIKTASSAPSGCDSQCWYFAAVKDKSVIHKMSNAVEEKAFELLNAGKIELPENYLLSKKKMLTFFNKAPVVIAVFMTKAEFYDGYMISALKEQGYTDRKIMELFADYDLLSIGAAVQNLLLAAHEKGLGACWMNEPAIAAKEISDILSVPKDYKFISLIPVGYPAYSPHEKKLKDLDKILKII